MVDLSGAAVATFERVSLVETAYERLREDIIFGRLAPAEKLRIDDLRSRYGLGSTPLREALSRLTATGLVEATSQRGFRVTPISEDDLEDVARLRVRLETDALRESIEHGDERWEEAVAGAHHLLNRIERRGLRRDDASFAAWEERNRAFHESIVSACRSRWTLRFRLQIYDQHERYRRISHVSAPARARDVTQEHAAIRDAALSRDADTACRLTERHIMRTIDAIRTIVKHPPR
ncbi:MAG: transcriptional regulator, GntR family [Candidatus Eremiobacteraeota bacterium]|nr:transcriptional regulator, GntR family [Candidatus Eremiobacteraeota bacterium]